MGFSMKGRPSRVGMSHSPFSRISTAAWAYSVSSLSHSPELLRPVKRITDDNTATARISFQGLPKTLPPSPLSPPIKGGEETAKEGEATAEGREIQILNFLAPQS